MPVTATTDLPDVTDLTLDATVEDQFTASWPDATNYGNYDVEYREADVGDPYTNVATVGEATTSQVIGGLSDGEKYDVRVRSRTEHRTGAWYTVAQVSFLPVPDGFSLSNPAAHALDAGWNDPVEGENGYRVYLAKESDTHPQGGTGFGTYQEAADVAPDTTSTTLSGLDHNTTYRAYAEVYTEHVVASTGTDTLTTLVDYAAGDWTTVLTDAEGDKLPLYPETVQNYDLQHPHTALADYRIRLPYQGARMDYWEDATTVVEHFYDGERQFLGYLERVEHQERQATTAVEGRGVARDLADIELSLSFTGTPTWEAIEAAWAYAPFSTNVVPPTETATATNVEVQEADTTAEFDSLWTPAATDPWSAKNNTLVQLKSGYFRTASNRDSDDGFALDNEDSGAIDGTAWGVSTESHSLTWNIGLEYTIPEEYVGFAWRLRESPDAQEMEIVVDGTVVDYLNGNEGLNSDAWQEAVNNPLNGPLGGFTGGDLSGTVQVTIQGSGSAGDRTMFDAVALYDTRYFDYTEFVNQVDANQELPGPVPYPETEIETEVSSVTANVTDIALAATFDNVADGVLALHASNNGGTSYEPEGGATNTDSMDEPMESVGTNIRAKIRASGYGSQSESPTEKPNPRTLSAWTLTYDGTDLSVIDDSTFTGDLLSIQQKLHRRAGYNFATDHNADPVTIESFPAGAVVKTADWVVRDREAVTDLYDYANRVAVYGAEQSDGSRPKAVAKDADEIERLGGDPTADSGKGIRTTTIVDPDLATLDAVKSEARAQLSGHVAEKETTGTLETWPTHVLPGYAYAVDWHGDGETTETTLERVSIEEEHANDRGTLKFDRDRGNTPAIVEARYAQANITDLL